jgi:hypothetical protein
LLLEENSSLAPAPLPETLAWIPAAVNVALFWIS